MNDYSSEIKDLIEVGKKIKKVPNFFNESEVNGKDYQQIEDMIKKRNDKLNELMNHQKNLASEIGLDKNPNLEKLIDSESSIQELLERPNYSYDDLSKLIEQRDFNRVQNGYTNYNMKPRNLEEENQAIKALNSQINVSNKDEEFLREYNIKKDVRKNSTNKYFEERLKNVKHYKNTPEFVNKINDMNVPEPEKNKWAESENKAVEEFNNSKKVAEEKLHKENREKLISGNKVESQRRQDFLKERKERKEKEFYDEKWYAKDSLPDRYIKKRKKEKIKRDLEKRNSKIKQENADKVKKEAEIKKHKDFVDKYETNQEILKYDDFYKMYSPEKKEVQNFVNDPLNKLDYREAQINLSDDATSKKSQKELSKIKSEKSKIENQRYEENFKKDKTFTKDYITTKKNNTELEEKLSEIHGPLSEEELNNVKPQILENQKNNKFLEKNKERFDKINENIKEEVNNEIFEKEASELFKEKEASFKIDFNNDKVQLKGINKDIRTLKKKDINGINKKINALNANKENLSEEQYEYLSNLYKGQLGNHQEKLDELRKKKQDIKSNLKESRKNYLNSEDPKTYQKEINRLNKDLKTLEDLDIFHNAQKKVDTGDMTRENFDALKNDLFGESEIVSPKRTKKEIEKEIENNMKLVKKFGGNVTGEVEEDIVDTFKNKLKNASKFNLIFSSVSAISQYKDSRKDGKGVVSSMARAGLEFALAETLGGLPYMGLSLAKELPGAAIKGTEMLHTEVRKMNTASRFSVFGQAQFQDTDQLATMRQSGMEMAKMANYRLEQTLMGNEARYLHK